MIVPFGFLNARDLLSSYTADPGTGTGLRTDGAYAVGHYFTVSASITVSELGRKFQSGNSQDHGVKLWAVSGETLLASASVLAASASDALGFKWAAVTPVVLTPGVDYAIAADEFNAGDSWNELHLPSIQSVFTISFANYGIGTGVYPGVTDGFGGGKTYSTPAMRYVVN